MLHAILLNILFEYSMGDYYMQVIVAMLFIRHTNKALYMHVNS